MLWLVISPAPNPDNHWSFYHLYSFVFPKCHIVGIVDYVDFSNQPFSLFLPIFFLLSSKPYPLFPRLNPPSHTWSLFPIIIFSLIFQEAMDQDCALFISHSSSFIIMPCCSLYFRHINILSSSNITHMLLCGIIFCWNAHFPPSQSGKFFRESDQISSPLQSLLWHNISLLCAPIAPQLTLYYILLHYHDLFAGLSPPRLSAFLRARSYLMVFFIFNTRNYSSHKKFSLTKENK